MNKDNISGKFDQAAGKIKQGVGEAVGSQKLANQGAAQQVKGHAKEAWGNVKDAASDLGAKARAGARNDNARGTTHDIRESVTSTAQNVKEKINRGLEGLNDGLKKKSA